MWLSKRIPMVMGFASNWTISLWLQESDISCKTYEITKNECKFEAPFELETQAKWPSGPTT